MQLTQLLDSNTLLTYSMMTTPSPVQVSPSASNPSLAGLTFVVSCPRSLGTVKVAQIIISVPVDAKDKPADPTNLAQIPPPLSSASISSTGQDEWTVAAGVAPGVFVFTPKGGGSVEVSQQSLTITLTGIQVNTLVGTALVKVNEWASLTSGNPPPVNGAPSGSAAIAVPKFPYGFFAGDFGTDKPMIDNGERPTLTWVGTQKATYKMLWAKQTQDVSNIRTWSPTSNPPSPSLTDTTTFILEVSAQDSGQTVTLYFSLTVIVANPSFTAKDLTVLTTSLLQGAVTVGKVEAPANLALNGNLNATDVIATGNVSATKNVSGVDVTASGNVKATGNVTATDVTASRNASVTKDLTVTGTITAGALGTIPSLTVSGLVQAGRVVGGSMSSNGGLWVGGSFLRVDVGDTAAAGFYNNSNAPLIYGKNSHSNTGALTGLNVIVATKYDYGLSSNGWIGNYSGNSLITHLPTRKGHRVVTSPLSVEAEVQASGSARLTKGKATVQFEADVADIILHTSEHSYRVLLTATGQCNGLAVVNKSGDNFIVEELSNGTSDCGFDWFLIARKPEELGASSASTLPENMPELRELDLPGPPEE